MRRTRSRLPAPSASGWPGSTSRSCGWVRWSVIPWAGAEPSETTKGVTMKISLEGRAALVTGASSGIGRAAALALAESGADVCVHGHAHMAEAEAVAHAIVKLGRKAIAVNADITLSDEVNRLVRTMVKEFGRVDIAFANAGIMQLATLEETTDELWRRHLDINVTGAFLTVRRVVPEMKRLGKGKIITNGSIFGAYGVPGAVAYCVTQMAIHGLTRALAIELAPHRINVNAVA